MREKKKALFVSLCALLLRFARAEALQRGDCKLIASIWGNTPSELAYLAGKVERMGADAVEVSVSAPLGTRMEAGTVPREIFDFVSAVTGAVDIPVSVKLSYEAAVSPAFSSCDAVTTFSGIVVVCVVTLTIC